MSRNNFAFRSGKVLKFLLTATTCLLSGIMTMESALAGEWRMPIKDDWKTIDLSNLAVKPGSALDFSFLVEKGEAGQHGFLIINDKGYFAFKNKPDVPVRLFCAPQLPIIDRKSNAIGFGDWDKQAEQIRMGGYNAVRAHFLDNFLMYDSKQECVFNPEKVDQFDRFAAALKKQGIYLVLDATTALSAFSTLKYWEKGAKELRMKQRLYYDEKTRELYKKGVRQILEHVNPYTGLALKDDPQVAWIALRNESGLNFLKLDSDPGLVKPWRQWLKKRYATREEWAAAWGTALSENVTFENATMPSQKERGAVGADVQRFITDIEQETYFWGLAFLKSLDVKVPVIDYNNGSSLQSIICRDVLPFVDNHGYHDWCPGWDIKQESLVDKQMHTYRYTIPTRALGKPYCMTETGGVFWSKYRHQDGLILGSFAAFQDWSLYAQHEVPVEPSIPATGIRQYGAARDPNGKVNERMIALLFARRDVTTSPHLVEVRIDAVNLYNKIFAGDTVSSSLTPLAILTGFGSRVVGGKNSAPLAPYKPDLIITPDKGIEMVVGDGAEIATTKRAGLDTAALVEKLRQKGVLDKANRTNIAAQIFESDTNEFMYECKKGIFRLVTPRSLGICLPNGGHSEAGAIDIENRGDNMALMLTSLSNEPISTSKRMLLIISGNALNSDMVFEDESMKRLVTGKLGKAPIIVRVLDVNFSAKLASPESWELWALDQTGTRQEKIPLTVNNGRITADIKTGKLKNGPTQYFELVSNDNK